MSKLETVHIELLNKYDDVLTVEELKQVLKIGRNKAYELVNTQVIKSIKVGTHYRIPKISIVNYLQNQTS